MKKALLVIDIQEITVGKEHAEMFRYGDSLLSDINRVIGENRDNLVVYIRNVMKKNLINKFVPFHAYEGSREAELAEGLDIVSDKILDKYTGDAFSNNRLDELLKADGVDRVEIIGVDGGGCVALTALGALKNGYSVTVNTTAVGTVFEKKRDAYFKKLREQGAEFV